MDGTVLLADDDRSIRTVLTQALTRAGLRVHATSSLTTLMRWAAEGRGDVVISDVKMPDGNGIEMLPHLKETRPDLPVIIISAQNTIMTAVQASEAQAFDYLPKPFDLPDLMARVRRALAQPQKAGRSDAPRPAEPESLPLVGRAPVMQALYREVARVIGETSPILLTGASGVGKSLLARALHDLSERASLPFVVATAEDFEGTDGPTRLLARVRGGTLVVDRLDDLPLAHQARLLQMIDQPGAHEPRFIATQRGDPAQVLEAGGLREDLFYRLSAAVLHLPDLRERVEDIPDLVAHVLRQQGEGAEVSFAPEALALLQTYRWPGNVRQFEHVIRALAAARRAGQITRAEVEEGLRRQPQAAPALRRGEDEQLQASVARHVQRYFDMHGDTLPDSGVYARIMREVEQPLLRIALDATGGNQLRCAEMLGINRNTLRKKLSDLDIEVTRRRKLM